MFSIFQEFSVDKKYLSHTNMVLANLVSAKRDDSGHQIGIGLCVKFI